MIPGSLSSNFYAFLKARENRTAFSQYSGDMWLFVGTSLPYVSGGFYMYNLSYHQTAGVEENLTVWCHKGSNENCLWVSSSFRFTPRHLPSSHPFSGTSSFSKPASLSVSLLIMGSLWNSRENWHLHLYSLFPNLYLIYTYSVLLTSKYFVTKKKKKSLTNQIFSNYYLLWVSGDNFLSSKIQNFFSVVPLFNFCFLDPCSYTHITASWNGKTRWEQNRIPVIKTHWWIWEYHTNVLVLLRIHLFCTCSWKNCLFVFGGCENSKILRCFSFVIFRHKSHHWLGSMLMSLPIENTSHHTDSTFQLLPWFLPFIARLL